MTAGRVLVTPRSLTELGLEAVPELGPVRERGYELVGVTPGRMPTEDQLLEVVPGCVGWLAGVERISERVLASATGLRVISRNGSGTDAIDMAAAARAGVRVERAVGSNAQGVAELALALSLSALRHVPWSAAALVAGRWERTQGVELPDCTVGIVGLGAIGRRTAHAFSALGSRVVGFDPFVTDTDVPVMDLDELLEVCDVISLHCPPAADGAPMIDASRLSCVTRGAVLVNTARSALVDDNAVLAALEAGTLGAYAVDAFDAEPPEITALLRHPRVIATPHLGGYTHSSVRRATAQAVENLMRALDQG
jgi:D-3-phosphoglycerate dehydrogenase / 2-oxoglutarate reductase